MLNSPVVCILKLSENTLNSFVTKDSSKPVSWLVKQATIFSSSHFVTR